MNSFYADLASGLHVEKLVLDALQRKYPCATMINAHKGYDIWVPETHKGIEVKHDPMSNQTGNFVIEVEFNAKPSALLTTTADYWIIYDDRVFAWFKPRRIFECIILNEVPLREFIGDGDSVAKRAYLVKKELLFMYAETITKHGNQRTEGAL